ncbi:HlyD family efflux transporter periplasmic adaptor subunit [Halomonas campisalis]|uniref:HlyD family efflux transporter periplasmic adaptor subunit n=1 Tax=Billgrantia campisalis TaxID=74661 RepID=A0ABS9PC07_9GAMM|nr:HlyD family efflux transporter periplasmic adaptor subunit [Halomonas campisalis]MCG6658650.1 HlyD family efflux transporter periplasmic adaptor subunit [Halomonas campisalis]MDR5864084.1 HlyD family efflux transporter periplasmic adaptor subunit [Halomonas campisalis]
MIKRLVPLLILAIGVAGFAALRLTRPEPPAVAPQERSWRVEAMQVNFAERVPVLPLFGELVAPERVSLVAPMAGRVAERPVRDGQRVGAGALLLALDEADTLPPLRQAEAEVADLAAQIDNERIRYDNDRQALEREREILGNAARQLERTRSLVERNLSSQSELDAARDAVAQARLTVTQRESQLAEHPARLRRLEAQRARAEALRDAAQRDAERSRVVAPFEGIVSGVQVAPGDQVGARAGLLSLYPPDGLELRARVPQRYQDELGALLSRGETLTARAVEGGQRFVLDRLAGEGDPAGTEAILTLAGAAAGLRPGSLVAVLLERPAVEGALAVPFSALHGSDVLYRIDDDSRLARTRVERLGETPGPDGERWLLVRAAELSEGDRIAITHLPNAMQGLRVELAEDSRRDDAAEEPEA